ncbi:MAG: shikimate dehydrogenase [Solirubrobacterales bacterium]|nr:shikimate dehydrogenase [Solirubrobacterales bacterium]
MSPRADSQSHRVGLIGADIGPSLSPALHEREAEELGLDYVYERIDISALGLPARSVGALLRDAHKSGFLGVNVTHPCKQLVVEHLSELSSEAATLGAVNTVVFDGDTAVGHNTDWRGFQESFARALPDVEMRRVVLLGAGGAGSAVAHAVLSLGAERLLVSDVQPQRADALAQALGERYGAQRAGVAVDLARAVAGADGLVNATPIGMASHPGMPLPADLLHDELWVAEVVYRPLETELLRRARRLGCRTLDGGGMAVAQAALSFALFTGVQPDRERMRRHFAEMNAPHPVQR